MKKIFKNSLFTFILGGIIFASIGVYAATTLLASNIIYDNSSSGLSSTDVQSAINELSEKSNDWIDPTTFGMKINSAKTIIATNGGIIFRRNGTTHLIRNNNYSVEKDHIQQIFSDASCNVYSSSVVCNASDYNCVIREDGNINITSISASFDYSHCNVSTDGSINCS